MDAVLIRWPLPQTAGRRRASQKGRDGCGTWCGDFEPVVSQIERCDALMSPAHRGGLASPNVGELSRWTLEAKRNHRIGFSGPRPLSDSCCTIPRPTVRSRDAFRRFGHLPCRGSFHSVGPFVTSRCQTRRLCERQPASLTSWGSSSGAPGPGSEGASVTDRIAVRV
jgi:hypothetical protein